MPLRRDQFGLGAGAGIGMGDKEISLVAEPQVHPLVEIVEEGDALPDQLDLLGVVELQAEGAGSNRRGQGRQCGTLFQDDRPEPGALREKRRSAADDAAADDDEVGGSGR